MTVMNTARLRVCAVRVASIPTIQFVTVMLSVNALIATYFRQSLPALSSCGR